MTWPNSLRNPYRAGLADSFSVLFDPTTPEADAMNDSEIAKITRALNHPTRITYLRALRGSGSLSPVEFSRDSGEALGNVSYHVKALKEAGVVEVVESVPRRGAVEHRYSLTSGKRSDATLAALDLLTKA
jgi:DNA-binding transcriptional ArsR family regulator